MRRARLSGPALASRLSGLSTGQASTQKPRISRAFVPQGRQDSNLQPPVLETGALPVELRPSASFNIPRVRRRSLAALFAALSAGFLAIGVYAALQGGSAWVIALACAALGAWMGELSYRAFRP
jgi:hypothetical protein